jgi:uncharacterized membrane-anchored protein
MCFSGMSSIYSGIMLNNYSHESFDLKIGLQLGKALSSKYYQQRKNGKNLRLNRREVALSGRQALKKRLELNKGEADQLCNNACLRSGRRRDF